MFSPHHKVKQSMKPKFFGALLLALFLAPSLVAASGDAAAPETGADWYVISPEGFRILERFFPVGLTFGPGRRIESMNVERDRVRLCVIRIEEKEPLERCALLFHPLQAMAGDVRAGVLAIHTDRESRGADEWRGLAKIAKKVPDTLWTRVRKEESGPVGSNAGWVAAVRHLLNRDEGGYALRLLESVERFEGRTRLVELFTALVLGQKGDYEEARVILERLNKDRADDPLISLARGRLLMLKGEAEGGAAAMAEALANLAEGSRSRCDPPLNVARLLARRERRDAAVAAWKAVEARFPDCKTVRISLGEQLLAWGRTGEALALWDRWLKISPKAPEVLMGRVTVLRRLKRLKEAMAELDRINTIKPNDESVITLHSTIASSLQDLEDYRQRMLERAGKDPDDLFAAHAAGVMSYYYGDYTTAKAVMDRLKTRMPKNARVHIYAAMSRYQLGDWEGARKGIEKLAEIGTKDPDLYYCMAMIWSTKDIERAREALEVYLAVPHHPDAVPEKQIRAWRQWQELGEGKVPADWLPGHGHEANNRGIDAGGGRTESVAGSMGAWIAFALGAAFVLLAGFLIGYRTGKR